MATIPGIDGCCCHGYPEFDVGGWLGGGGGGARRDGGGTPIKREKFRLVME